MDTVERGYGPLRVRSRPVLRVEHRHGQRGQRRGRVVHGQVRFAGVPAHRAAQRVQDERHERARQHGKHERAPGADDGRQQVHAVLPAVHAGSGVPERQEHREERDQDDDEVEERARQLRVREHVHAQYVEEHVLGPVGVRGGGHIARGHRFDQLEQVLAGVLQHRRFHLVQVVVLRVVHVPVLVVRQVQTGHVAEIPEYPEVRVRRYYARLEQLLAHHLPVRMRHRAGVHVHQIRVALRGLEHYLFAARAAAVQVYHVLGVLRPRVLGHETVRGLQDDLFASVEQKYDRSPQLRAFSQHTQEFYHHGAVHTVIANARSGRHRIEMAVQQNRIARRTLFGVYSDDNVLQVFVAQQIFPIVHVQDERAANFLVVHDNVIHVAYFFCDILDFGFEKIKS